MAQRSPQRAKKPAARGAAGATPATATSSNPAERIQDLERERDQLRAELEAAKARIASLEQAREQALNRIDWVIDSLHNLQND